MPRHIRWVVRLFDEERRAPAQNVRANDVLDRIEDSLMPDQIVQPGEQKVGFLPEFPGEEAVIRFECLEPGSGVCGFRGRKHPYGCEVTGIAVALNQFASQ